MNLFEKAIAFVRSVGHRVEEHNLINDFVNYVGKETSIVENFLKSKQMEADDQARAVVSNFVAEIAPVNPTPVLVAPPPVVETPANVTVNVEESASATVTVTTPINPEQNVAS
jgi:hypothetical protein